MRKLNRREFLQTGAIYGGILTRAGAMLAAASQSGFAGGKLLGSIDFVGEGFQATGTRMGSELDARFYTDLSRLSERRLVTPTAEFYLRTAVSELLPNPEKWTIRIDGLAGHTNSLGMGGLRRSARPMGLHLMECAGNTRITHFGLISVANWTGMPVSEVLNGADIKNGSRVLVSGFDQYASESRTSIPGASWIFRVEELKAARAFLAIGMNGQPLTPDHGAPVRLVVPGWYGCACIKWVNSITLVEESADSTLQMQEYASRTLQDGIPSMAREYRPATIDPAAIPVRIEKWSVSGRIKYRVIGILWGGSEPVNVLEIRFNPDEDFVRVNGFRQTRNDPWTIWTHAWSPKVPGSYSILLRVADPRVQARKLNSGYYVRSVEIADV